MSSRKGRAPAANAIPLERDGKRGPVAQPLSRAKNPPETTFVDAIDVVFDSAIIHLHE